MVKSKRFEPIADLARNSEREAAKALGQALQQLQQEQQQLEQLIGYRADYRRRLNDSASQGMSVQTVNEFREFITKLSLAIEQQQQTIEVCRQVLEEKKSFWFSKRGRSKALDAVLDKYIKNEQQLLEKREQRELDDRNNRPKSE
jgi:flagellar FliJ protein